VRFCYRVFRESWRRGGSAKRDRAALAVGGRVSPSAGADDPGRERLMRYGARPPLALDRLRRLPDGRIAYRIKKLRGGRAKHRVMTPLEFLARLAAIVPPPRHPLLRYGGVLGPRSPWRRDVVPRPPKANPKPCDAAAKQHEPQPRPNAESAAEPAGIPGAGTATRATKSTPTDEAAPLLPIDVAVDEQAEANGQLLTPNVLSVKHWNRLLGGALYAASPRVDWASLLRRSFEVDVLGCPSCGGRLRVLGEVTEPAMIKLVLAAIGISTDAPRVARARDPTDMGGEHAVA